MLRSTDYRIYLNGIEQLRQSGAAAVPELIEALESGDWDLHNGAVETLARIGKPAVPVLMREAKAGRLAAVEALAELGPEAVDALPVLRELVVSNSSGLGVAATRALAAIGSPGVPALVAGLNQADGEVRDQCANTLGWVGPPAQEAVPDLVALLWSSPGLQETAVRSLRRIGLESEAVQTQLATRLTSPDALVRKGAVLGLSAARDPDKFAIQQIINVARNDPDPQVRSAALTSLAWMAPANEQVARTLVAAMAKEQEDGLIFDAANALAFLEATSQVMPELIDLLKNGSTDARTRAALVLGFRGADARPAIPELRALLKDPDPILRSEAADALARLGPDAKEAAPDIATALVDQRINLFVAVATLPALASSDPGVVATLITLLETEVSKEQQRKQEGRPPALSPIPWSPVAGLIHALGSSGHAAQAATPLITSLSDDDEPLVRRAVISAYANISSNSVGAVDLAIRRLKDNDSSVRIHAAQTLGQMRQQAIRAVPGLCAALEDTNAHFKAACARALGLIGDPAAMPALIQALRDRSAETRIEAACALLTLQPDHQPAWRILTDELGNHWAGYRADAASKLADLGPAASDAVVPLVKLLEDRRDVVRAAAVRALGRIGPAAAVAIAEVRKACQDPYPTVRKEAMLALKQLEP